MIRLFFPLLLLVIAIVLARRYIAAAPPGQAKSRKITVLLWVLFLVLLVLTLEHRMHWLATLVPPVMLAAQKLFSILSRFFQSSTQTANHSRQQRANDAPVKPSPHPMDEQEAHGILGLKKPFTDDDVIDSHRKLMQKLHPDHGGNDYLAAKINEARDVLLKNR